MASPFNATRWPRLAVQAAFSSSPAGVCTLDHGVLGTNVLGGLAMVDITADVRSISIRRGRDSELDAAQVGSCRIVLGNRSGDYDPSNLSGPYVAAGASLVDLGAAVTVTAEYPTGMYWPRFTGRVTDIDMDAGLDPTVTITCADGLEDLGRARLPTEAAEFDGDSTGERINNLADRAGWPTLARAIDAGTVTLGPTSLGATALELMRKVESTEFGLLWVDGDGNLVFYDRHRAETANRSQLVQAALTDTSGPGEVGMVSLELSVSRDLLINDAHGTREPNITDPEDSPSEQSASDATSTNTYGVLSLPTQVGQLARSDAEVLALLQGIVDRYSTSQLRIRSVRINALRGGTWTTLLGLQLLDRISVSRDYGPATITGELLLQGMTEDISVSPPRWDMTWTTSEPPAPLDACTLDAGLIDTDLIGW